MQVFCTITAKNGERVPIEVAEDATPTALRQQVASATKIPLSALRLIFRGKMVKDDDSTKAIEEYKLEADCVLHCMGKPVEEESTATTATATANATATTPPLAAAAPPAAAARPAPVVPSVSAAAAPAGNRSVSAAILRLRSNNPPSVYQTALTTLEKILSNIVGHPMEEKYRKGKCRILAKFSAFSAVH